MSEFAIAAVTRCRDCGLLIQQRKIHPPGMQARFYWAHFTLSAYHAGPQGFHEPVPMASWRSTCGLIDKAQEGA